MPLVSTAWQLVSSILVFFAGLVIAIWLGRKFKLSGLRAAIIYFWHTLFCFVYLWFVLSYGGDALSYFLNSTKGYADFGVGTAGVNFITSFFVQTFDLSLLGTFLLHNVFGSIGLLAFAGSLRHASLGKTKYIRRLVAVIIFLPSISFWSSALGKDALAFMAAGLVLWAAIELKNRKILMGIGIAAMFLVRPHIAGFMVLALIGASVFDSRSPGWQRATVAIIALVVSAFLIPFALNYAGVGEDVDAEGLSEYVDKRQSVNAQGDTSVDIASMSWPMKLFTYMFRPILLEARNVFSLAAAIDNSIILFLFFVGWRGLLRRRSGAATGNRTFLLLYVGMAWVVLAFTTANLGIALRQKWMFAPMLIFILVASASDRSRRNVFRAPLHNRRSQPAHRK